MLDIKFVRENKDIVINNIKNKFQDEKIALVDEVLEIDNKVRELKLKGDELRSKRNTLSSEIGLLMRDNIKKNYKEHPCALKSTVFFNNIFGRKL